MSATAEDVLATLKSIERYAKDTNEMLATLADHCGAFRREALKTAPADTVPAIAPDRDLDGQYGNPEVKAKDPRDWTGDSMKGRRLSECPPEYLDMLASRLDYFAGKEEDAKKARYNALDASRARGWAARLRGGWKAPAETGGFPSDSGAPLTDDQIPF